MSVPPPPMPATTTTDTSQDDRTMAMVAYILGIFTWWVGPLVIWLIKKDQSRFVAYHAMQALFLWGAVTVGYIVGGILAFVGIGFLVMGICHLAGVILSIMAALAANKGDWYDMPVIGKLVRQQMKM